MADLTTNFLGISSPNPYWLASAPPTDKEYNVRRAFEAGWGGVVWKTLGEAGPPIVNVNGPRYGAIYGADRRLLGLNNIELITDRPLETNLEEMARVKADYPDHALIAWDGKRCAARALGDAMDILEDKARVTVLEVGKDTVPRTDTLLRNLERHGIDAQLVNKPRHRSIAQTVLDTTEEVGARLIVMGAYEHSRFQHNLIGGVTTDVMAKSTVPVFLSH